MMWQMCNKMSGRAEPSHVKRGSWGDADASLPPQRTPRPNLLAEEDVHAEQSEQDGVDEQAPHEDYMLHSMCKIKGLMNEKFTPLNGQQVELTHWFMMWPGLADSHCVIEVLLVYFKRFLVGF